MFDFSNPCVIDDDFPNVDFTTLCNGEVYNVIARFMGEPDICMSAQFLRKGTIILTECGCSCGFPRVIDWEERLMREAFIQNDGFRMDKVLTDGFYTMDGRYIPDVKLQADE